MILQKAFQSNRKGQQKKEEIILVYYMEKKGIFDFSKCKDVTTIKKLLKRYGCSLQGDLIERSMEAIKGGFGEVLVVLIHTFFSPLVSMRF